MDGLRILLVSPRGTFLSSSAEFQAFMDRSQEMRSILHYWNGLGAALPTVAGLTPERHLVEIVDENYEEIDFDRECDIVGITGMTQQATRAYEIAEEFRSRGRHVAMGGIHATTVPEEALAHADSVFVGEAENTWPAFIQEYSEGSPRRIYRQSDHEAVDMTRIPLPRYDLIARYPYPVVWLQSTRGCPHDCDFCAASTVYGSRYRHKSVEQVSAEIREVKRHWKYAQVGFADDNMFVDQHFARELVEAFKNLRFTWYAQSDISVAEDESFLRALYDSGCRIIFIGLESVSKGNLATLNRNLWKARQFDRYAESIERIQRNGIGVYGSFMIGLEEDTLETFSQTADFINKNNIMGIQITILTPFPGSRLRRRLEQQGRILHSDWQWYTAWNPLFVHPHLSPDELQRGLLEIYTRVYNEQSFRERAAYFRRVCEALVNRG